MSSYQEDTIPLIPPAMKSSPPAGCELSTIRKLLKPYNVVIVIVFLLLVYILLLFRFRVPIGSVYEISEQSDSFHQLLDKITHEANTDAKRLKPVTNTDSEKLKPVTNTDAEKLKPVTNTTSGTSGSARLLNTTKPVMLLWTGSFFPDPIWIPDLKTRLHCPVHNCLVTNDRTMLNQSSAVILYFPYVDINDLPVTNHKQKGQKWILFNLESPENSDKFKMSVLSELVDMAATYRKDSTLFAPYGVIERTNDAKWKLDKNVEDKIAGKKKMAAWLVSNCETPSHREYYVMKLKRYLNVDIYGGCGPLECLPKRSSGCYEMIEKDYWFYLSFENSICKDYVTEKLFDALKRNIVPVVMGGADYGSLMPGEVFYVDALNFTSPKHLAEFLNNLVKDGELYKSYLMWKTRYAVKYGAWIEWACDLCEMLQKNRMSVSNSMEGKLQTKDKTKTKNLYQWWYREGNCTNWRENL